MKRVFVLGLLFFLISVQPVLARSGCCSHHGGVCGCGCCDGSPLSSTCAPYYPECSTQTPTSTYTPIPTITPYPTDTPTPTVVPTPSVTVLEAKDTSSNDSLGGIITLVLLGGLGFGGYKLAKRLLGKS